MNIEELIAKAKELVSLRNKCTKEWDEYMWDRTRKVDDVHFCDDTCPIGKLCNSTGLGTCELLVDCLEIFKNEQKTRNE